MLGEAQTYIIAPSSDSPIVRCLSCGKLLQDTKENFLLGLLVREGCHEFRYLVRQKKPTICCGQEKTLLESFQTETEVKLAEKKILDYLQEHRSTRGLSLAAFGQFVRTDLN